MREALKNTIIEFYKSGIQENIDLADVIMDNQKNIPMRQLKAINNAINGGAAFSSRHAWKFSAVMYEEKNKKSYNESNNKKSYNKSKTSLKYINK